jgi:hypothetical protein
MDPMFIDGWTSGNGFRLSSNTESVAGVPEGVVAPSFEVDIRAEFGTITWVPDTPTFAAGWRYLGASAPKKAADGLPYITYRFSNPGFFTNVSRTDPLLLPVRFGGYATDSWTSTPGAPAPSFTSRYRATMPTRVRTCSAGKPVMTTQIISAAGARVGSPAVVIREHNVSWVEDWGPTPA